MRCKKGVIIDGNACGTCPHHEHPKWLGEVEKSLPSNPDLTLILVSYHLSAEWKRQFDQVYDLAPVRV